MNGDIVAAILIWIAMAGCVGFLLGLYAGHRDGYRKGMAYAATMSLSSIPRNDWLEAVIDAKARKEKEALK